MTTCGEKRCDKCSWWDGHWGHVVGNCGKREGHPITLGSHGAYCSTFQPLQQEAEARRREVKQP